MAQCSGTFEVDRQSHRPQVLMSRTDLNAVANSGSDGFTAVTALRCVGSEARAHDRADEALPHAWTKEDIDGQEDGL